MIKYYKFIIFIFLVIIFLIGSFRFFGEKKFLITDSCGNPMLWLHAVKNHKKLIYASELKYCGVEVDTTLSSDQKLIASYNKPDDINAINLIDLLAKEKNIKYWWIDFKNLNLSNYSKASQLIDELSKKHRQKKIFIESHNFFGLWLLNIMNDNVYKVYWLSKGPNQNSKFNWSMPLYYFRAIMANIIINPDFISMFHHQVDKSNFLWVGNRNVFTFTVNSFEEYKKVKDNGVKVILTDNLRPNY